MHPANGFPGNRRTDGRTDGRTEICGIILFSPSHLSASTLRSVPARIMPRQCLRSSAISVVIWFLAISSFARSRHLSFAFGLPRFLFPSTVICNIVLVASSLYLLCTCPNHLNLFSLRNSAMCALSRCLHFSHDLVSSFLVPTAACAFQLCAISSSPSF